VDVFKNYSVADAVTALDMMADSPMADTTVTYSSPDAAAAIWNSERGWRGWVGGEEKIKIQKHPSTPVHLSIRPH
jgi:hypothetical protein